MHFELKVVRGEISECWHTGKDLKVLRGNDYRPCGLVSKVLPLYRLVPRLTEGSRLSVLLDGVRISRSSSITSAIPHQVEP